MKFKVEFTKESITNIGEESLYIDYYLSVDNNPKINTVYNNMDVEIKCNTFVVRSYHRTDENRRKIFHDFKLFSNMDDNFLLMNYNVMSKLFVKNYVEPNKVELMEAIDKAITKYIIQESI